MSNKKNVPILMQNAQNGTFRKTESTKLSKKVSSKNGICTVRYANGTVFGKIRKPYCIRMKIKLNYANLAKNEDEFHLIRGKTNLFIVYSNQNRLFETNCISVQQIIIQDILTETLQAPLYRILLG